MQPLTTVDDVWRESLELIRKRVNPQAYHTWFSSVSLRQVASGICTVVVPNAFFVEMMAGSYSSLIQDSVGTVVAQPVDRVEFVVADPGATVGLSVAASIEVANQAGATPAPTPAPTPTGSSHPMGAARRQKNSVALNSKYTFAQFVVGADNQFAHAAAQAVADNPAKSYNPMFIYGDVGLGKTHLLHAIGNRIMQRDRGRRITYVSSEQFTNEVINSIRYDRMADFRARYRSSDILLVDDIQFIAGKDRTQEEFFHTFNTLYEAGKQIVLSSDRFPKEMPDIEERLRSRFEWGLIADIQPPDLETKIAILQKKADTENIPLPEDVALLLATHIKSNVRELEGALIRLGAHASLNGRTITEKMARETLRDIIKDVHRVVSLDEIQQMVAGYYHVKVSDLKGKRRTKDLVAARQVAMYLCRNLAERSYPDIGRGFGGRDHTTALHACRQIDKRMAVDMGLKSSVDQLTRRLTEGS